MLCVRTPLKSVAMETTICRVSPKVACDKSVSVTYSGASDNAMPVPPRESKRKQRRKPLVPKNYNGPVWYNQDGQPEPAILQPMSVSFLVQLFVLKVLITKTEEEVRSAGGNAVHPDNLAHASNAEDTDPDNATNHDAGDPFNEQQGSKLPLLQVSQQFEKSHSYCQAEDNTTAEVQPFDPQLATIDEPDGNISERYGDWLTEMIRIEEAVVDTTGPMRGKIVRTKLRMTF